MMGQGDDAGEMGGGLLKEQRPQGTGRLCHCCNAGHGPGVGLASPAWYWLPAATRPTTPVCLSLPALITSSPGRSLFLSPLLRDAQHRCQ